MPPPQVHLLVRGERLRASAAMQDRVAASPKITVHLSTEIEDAFGDAKGMQGLHLKDTRTGGWGTAGGLLALVHPCVSHGSL